MTNVQKIKEILAQLAASLGVDYNKNNIITSITADDRLIHIVFGLLWSAENPPEEMPLGWKSEIEETSPGIYKAVTEAGFKAMNHFTFCVDTNHEAYFLQIGDLFAMLSISKEKCYLPSWQLAAHDQVVSEIAKDIGYDLAGDAAYASISRCGWSTNTVEIIGAALPYCTIWLTNPKKAFLPRDSVMITPADKRSELDEKLMVKGYLAYFGDNGGWGQEPTEVNKVRIYVKQFGDVVATINTTLS